MTRLASARRPSANDVELVASGLTDPGTQREVNEDRFYCDAERGLFIVIDGVGGQAAGGKAADVALAILREQLARRRGATGERLRAAIATANNEIHRLASTRPEWHGMACVLTVAIVEDGLVTFGHVGDTRLYKLHHGAIEKLTRDHSPVGEREDARELSEQQAMRHPRRNEVYRDVGSETHAPGDGEFIDIGTAAFERDAALLLCSDGLTDLIDSATIAQTVRDGAGDPAAVVRALVDGANAAGGRDNVTAVYVEGKAFAATTHAHGWGDATREDGPSPTLAGDTPAVRTSVDAERRGRRTARAILALLLTGIAAAVLLRTYGPGLGAWMRRAPVPAVESLARRIEVPATGSIAAALRDAAPGTEIVVDPGEYREQLMLKSGVRVVSRIPRGATIRLPAATPDAAHVPAVLAREITGAELAGFAISGDSATPLAVGILVDRADLSIVDVEISGAALAAVEFAGGGSSLIASDIRDNPGVAIAIRNGARPRISHNTLARNAMADGARAPLVVERGTAAEFVGNVFMTANPGSFTTLDAAAFATLHQHNWFVTPPARNGASAPRHGLTSGR